MAGQLDGRGFAELMRRFVAAVSARDTEAALGCFAPDAVYLEPPSRQRYRGHAELGPFFDGLRPGAHMAWHNVWFDEARQVGAGEYTYRGVRAFHGVAVIEVTGGRFGFWREYQRDGDPSFAAFLDRDGRGA